MRNTAYYFPKFQDKFTCEWMHHLAASASMFVPLSFGPSAFLGCSLCNILRTHKEQDRNKMRPKQKQKTSQPQSSSDADIPQEVPQNLSNWGPKVLQKYNLSSPHYWNSQPFKCLEQISIGKNKVPYFPLRSDSIMLFNHPEDTML